MQPYDRAFFNARAQGSLASAKVIVPLLLELIGPQSVADVGCGNGAWLSVFRELGVEDVHGVDGPWVRHSLTLPAELVTCLDLTKPFHLPKTYDLALSLEVAEHLPEPSALPFVQSLTRLSKVVAFSAAIPGQGGTNHVNEQWPDYWAGLFAQQGYRVVDCIRGRIWNSPEVDWWYAQNLLLFVEERHLQSHPGLLAQARMTNHSPLSIVHPRLLLEVAETSLRDASLHSALSFLKGVFGRILRRLKR
jgi:SAM-dependent methyltransferase